MTKWINAEAVEEEYGLPKETVRTMIRLHKLPFHRPMRGTVLFDREELEAWIERGRVEPLEVKL